MIGIIGYLIACFIVACILTLIWAMFRPIKNRGEMRSWRVTLVLFFVICVAPYVYAEILTRGYGKPMEPAVQRVIDDIGCDGGVKYYKIIRLMPQQARVIAVGIENASWGGTENPVVAITLSKMDDDWKVEQYNVVTSMDRNEDSMTFPPYW